MYFLCFTCIPSTKHLCVCVCVKEKGANQTIVMKKNLFKEKNDKLFLSPPIGLVCFIFCICV